ncbi:MAG: division/cell wall cluster transcriptional repressor MraZ [Clostridia bacterium]|nr:division/cell wall cluster transcriptional repressor MraZ [Clostridia bacterium]
MSFVGSFPHSLDAKKRVFIPSKYREELGNEFYITKKFDPYLSVYTAQDWEEYSARISALPEAEAYHLQEYILGSAQKCTPDSSGRVIIDEKLLKHASINKNVVFVGAGKQIKIWAEELWTERENTRDLENIKNLMIKYGL